MRLGSPAIPPVRRLAAGAGAVVLGLAGALAAAAQPAECPRASSAAVARAYRHSTWVVRARLAAADDHWADAGQSWSLIHTQILRAYKGRPPSRLDILTHGDDAGPWLDRGSISDLGQDYLLFLRPAPPGSPMEGVAMVSDGCGASRPWSRVSREEIRSLESPAGRFVLAERGALRSAAPVRRVRVATAERPRARRSRHWRWPAPIRALFFPHTA